MFSIVDSELEHEFAKFNRTTHPMFTQVVAYNHLLYKAKQRREIPITRLPVPDKFGIEDCSVVLSITTSRLKRAAELYQWTYPHKKNKYRILLNKCTIDGEQLTFTPHYSEDASGRLHCWELTGIPVEFRNEMFDGFHQGDIRSCHLSVLCQRAKAIDPSLVTPVVDEYLVNAQPPREYLADLLAIPVDKAKAVITGFVFGGSVPSDAAQYHRPGGWRICDLLDKQQMRTLRLDRYWTDFRRETREILRTVVHHYKAINYKAVTNSFGLTMTLDRTIPAGVRPEQGKFKSWGSWGRIAHHIAVGDERNFLEIARQLSYGPIITLHDGFITKQPIDVGQLEQSIFDRTGFNIKYKHTVIGENTNMTDEPVIKRGKYKGRSLDELLTDKTYVKRLVNTHTQTSSTKLVQSSVSKCWLILVQNNTRSHMSSAVLVLRCRGSAASRNGERN